MSTFIEMNDATRKLNKSLEKFLFDENCAFHKLEEQIKLVNLGTDENTVVIVGNVIFSARYNRTVLFEEGISRRKLVDICRYFDYVNNILSSMDDINIKRKIFKLLDESIREFKKIMISYYAALSGDKLSPTIQFALENDMIDGLDYRSLVYGFNNLNYSDVSCTISDDMLSYIENEGFDYSELMSFANSFNEFLCRRSDNFPFLKLIDGYKNYGSLLLGIWNLFRDYFLSDYGQSEKGMKEIENYKIKFCEIMYSYLGRVGYVVENKPNDVRTMSSEEFLQFLAAMLNCILSSPNPDEFENKSGIFGYLY